MTVAVCIPCGSIKWGAFNPCPNCKYAPENLDDRVRHLLLTDHYLSKEDLDKISVRIKSGESPQFNEAELERMKSELARIDAGSKGAARFITCGLVVAALATILIVLAVFLIFRRSG